MINVSGLSVELDGMIVVDGISFTVEPGEIVVLSGPNGGGKTTILRSILGIIPHYIPGIVEGEVTIDGVDPRRDPARVRKLVQGTQQDPVAQVVGPTVFSEAALTPSLWGLDKSEVVRRARQAIERVGITHLTCRPVYRLSTGELVKTALAGILSVTPRYLLLDEPSSHIDKSSSKALSRILVELKSKGMGLLIASHDKRLQELADKCYTVYKNLREGCAEGPPLPEKLDGSRMNSNLAASMHKVWVRYPGSMMWALKDASIRVHEGEMIALLGPNGSGKTTLLLTLAGVIKPSKGVVSTRMKPALLPPDPLLLFSRGTLGDEAEQLPFDPPRWSTHLLEKPLLKASGGERRLAALALTVMSGRRLLLLDEPTVGLDPWNRRLIAETMLRLREDGYTIIYSTHDEELASLADRVYEFEDGWVREA